MKVFVTGGSGFIGGHLLEGLQRAGHETWALARSDRSAELVDAYGARPVRGELGAVAVEDLRGADAVIHAAANTSEWGTREAFWRDNVEGTEQLLVAAKEAGVRRFVHVGTEAALFVGDDLVNVDETAPYPTRHKYLYSETKAEAEKRVLAAASDGFETVSIRPRLVWGPRDTTVTPVILEMAEAGRFRWISGGAQLTSTTHVDNLVHALLLALERGGSGRAYFVADDGERTMRRFLTALAAAHGTVLPDKGLPRWLARVSARVVEGTYRVVRRRSKPPLTRFAIDMMSATVTVNTARAREELGYVPVVAFDEGMNQLSRV